MEDQLWLALVYWLVGLPVVVGYFSWLKAWGTWFLDLWEGGLGSQAEYEGVPNE
jgi:hypothetical protein